MTTETKATLSQHAHRISNMHRSMDRKGSEADLRILQHGLKAMGTAAAALSLPHIGSAPLFLGLTAAMIGIDSSASAAGIIGPSLRKVINGVVEGVSSSLMPNSGVGERQFLMMLSTISYGFMICLSSQLVARGSGRLPDSLEEIDVELTRFFEFELALKLVNGSSMMTEAFQVFIESCGGDAKAQRVGGAILTQVGQLLMMLASAKEGRLSLTYLVAEQANYLKQGVAAAVTAVANGEDEGSIDPAIAVAVNQLRVALEENKESEFMEAINGLLETVGTSQEALLHDIAKLNKVASMVIHVTGSSHEQESLTGIINVI